MHFVRSRMRVLCLLAAMSFLGIAAAPWARAVYTVTIDQVGPDVVAIGSGSLDVIGLVHQIGPTLSARMAPSVGELLLGPTTAQSLDFYKTISGPAAFGPGDGGLASSGSGGLVGIEEFSSRFIVVPAGYVSGTDLGTSTATFSNQTFSTLGITPGTYTWTWGSGADADSYTLQAGNVPEPASLSLLALAGVTLLRRRRGSGKKG